MVNLKLNIQLLSALIKIPLQGTSVVSLKLYEVLILTLYSIQYLYI